MKKMNSYNEYYINQALGKISNQPGVLPCSGLGSIHTDTDMALPFKLESDTSDFNLTSNLSSGLSSNKLRIFATYSKKSIDRGQLLLRNYITTHPQ